MTYEGTRVYWRTTSVADRPIGGAARVRHDPDSPDFASGGASCTRRGVDPDQFHPLGDTAGAEAEVDRVIATYCTPCPMREACEAWGRRVGRGTGIWGGVWLDRLGRTRATA